MVLFAFLACDPPSSILIVSYFACKLRNSISLNTEMRDRRNNGWTAVKALYVFSETVGEGVGLVGLRSQDA
jgi:hypothetical protein